MPPTEVLQTMRQRLATSYRRVMDDTAALKLSHRSHNQLVREAVDGGMSQKAIAEGIAADCDCRYAKSRVSAILAQPDDDS